MSTIHPMQVWQFRVRDHLKRHGSTKASRTTLLKKFGREATPLVQAVLAAVDAEAAYQEARSALRATIDPTADLRVFLAQADQCFDRFEESGLAQLPPALRKATKALFDSWKDGRAKFDKSYKPFEHEADVMNRHVQKLHTTWVRALKVAQDEHAKLDKKATP